MTTGDVLETLRVVIEADKTRLTQGLTAGVQESRQAGQQMGQSLRTGLAATLPALGGVGAQAGQQFGEGFTRDAQGRLRDSRGKFIKSGQDLGHGLADGLKQSAPAVDSAVNGLTAKLGGGAGSGLTGAFGRLTAGTGGLQAGLTGIIGMAGPAGAAIAGVTAAVGASAAVMNKAINEYTAYEYSLAKISTLTDKTPGQLRNVGQEIKELSSSTGKSLNDLSAGMYDVLGASVKGSESMSASLKLVETAAKLATAGATETTVATDVLTSVLNAYKMTATDAGSVSDKLFKTVEVGKISFDQLAQSLGMVTAISSQAGVSLDEVLAALATMTANGVQASSSVDYLRSLISSITKPSQEAAGLADKLGIAFNDQALKAKGLTGVLQEVMEKTGGSTAQLGILFGGVEAVTAATSIASGNFDRMGESMKAVQNAAGATETAYSKMSGTLKIENDKFAANWARLMTGMGEAWAPLKESFLKDLNELLNGANEFLEKFNRGRNERLAGENVEALETSLAEKRKYLEGGRAIISGEQRAPASLRQDWIDRRLPNTLREIAELERRITEARTAAAQIRAENAEYNAANGRNTLPANAQGPRFGGEGGPVANIPEEAGKFGLAFIQSLAKAFTNDSRVASDCAIIAYELLNKLGVKIKGTAVQNAWVPTLEKNAKASGFQEVALKDARPGDLVIFKSGNGIRYGAGSGMHAGLIAGTQNGQLMVADNPGTQANGQDGITRVRAIGRDAPQATIYRAPTSPFAAGNKPTGGGTDTDTDKEGPISAAQIVKAQQLLDAVEKAKKAMQADPKNNGLKIAYDQATQALSGWTAASKENARAAQAVRDSQTGAAKSASGSYIATAADLRKWGGDALRLYKDLEKAQATGSAQAVTTAERNIATWVGESKARGAVLAAETAAYKVREQQRREAEKGATETDLQREKRIQRERVAMEALEQTLRKTSRARLEAIVAGGVTEQTSLAKWEAARAEIERRDKPQADKDKSPLQREREAQREIQAQQALEKALRNTARARLEEIVAGGVTRDVSLDKWKGASTELARREQAAKDGKAQALKDGEEMARQAEQWAEQQEARDRERAQLLNRLANERRDLDTAAAQAALARVEELNRQELASFKGTGAQRLAIVKRQAEEEYNARVAAADVARRVGLEKSANTGGRNQASRDAGYEAAYTQAVLQAAGTRDNTIRQATEQQQTSIRNLRAEYSRLAESIRQKTEAGTFDAEAQQEATRAFNLLGRSAAEAGLSSDEYVAGARRSTWAAIQTGDAARRAAEDLATLEDQLESSSQAALENVKGPIAQAQALDELGNREAAIALLNGTLDDLRAQASEGGADVEAAFDLVTAALDRLNASVDQGALERAATFLANIREEADRAAEATERVADASLTEKDFADRDTVRDLAKGGASALTGFLTDGDFFGSRFWTELGEEGRERFRAEVGKLDSADFAVLGEETIRGFIAAIGDDEEWATLKALLVGRLRQIQEEFYQGLTGQGFAGFRLPSAQNLNGPDSQNMQMPGGQAQNYFQSFSDQLWGMGDALKDPLRLDAVSKDLQDAYEAGKLTAAQLNILKEIIASINAAPLDLAPTADETRFEGVVKQFDDLTASLEAGEISLEEYSNQAGPLSVKLDRLAVAAQAADKPELAENYAKLAAALRLLIPVADGAATKMEKFNKWLDYADQIAAGFQQIGGALGGNLGANIDGFGKAFGTVVGIARDLASQNYIGAAVKFFSSIAAAIGGFQKANREAIEKQKAFREQFTFLNGDDYAKTFVKSRGFFADFFGGGPEVKQEVDKVGLMYAKSAEDGWKSGLKNGMGEALAMNDFGVFSKKLREGVFQGLKEGMLDLFLNDTLLKEIIGPAVKAWSDALKTPGLEDDAAAMAGLESAVGRAEGVGRAYFDQVSPMLSGLQQRLGIGQDGQAGGMGLNPSSSGLTTGVSFAKVEVSLPPDLLRGASDLALAAPELRLGASELRMAVAEWREFMRTGRMGGYSGAFIG